MRKWLSEPRYDIENVLLSRGSIECDCGCEVDLFSSWANSCPSCPMEFNGSGQALSPRSQWGEETGETDSDLADLG